MSVVLVFVFAISAVLVCRRSYQLQVHTGGVLAGDKASYYGGQPVAYGLDPCENVVFCGCHDNETIFDQVTIFDQQDITVPCGPYPSSWYPTTKISNTVCDSPLVAVVH